MLFFHRYLHKTLRVQSNYHLLTFFQSHSYLNEINEISLKFQRHKFFLQLMYTICLSQRDQLRLGVDECMDRFNPSVKHHCYQVDFVPVVRNQGSDR